MSAGSSKGVQLLLGRTHLPLDNRPGMPHPLAGRSENTADHRQYRGFHLTDDTGCPFFIDTADLTAHDHRFGLVILLELPEDFIKGRTQHRVSPQPDTGSLAIGGIIAVFAIIIRKELLIPILCGIFLAESLSVMIQVGYFKYTKRTRGEGVRIFKMSPLHHHFQKLGYPEPKIVLRFFIVGIMLAVFTIITLKLR